MTPIGQQRLPNTGHGCAASSVDSKSSPDSAFPRRRPTRTSSSASPPTKKPLLRASPSPRRARSSSPLLENGISNIAQFLVKYQLGMSLTLLSLLPIAYVLVPALRPTVMKFVAVSNEVPEAPGKYVKGADDLYLVFTWIVAFTFLRAGTMDYLFVPFARFRGITGAKELVRFAEQAWLCVYYSFFWCWGMYLYVNSPYYLSLPKLWDIWPSHHLSAPFKLYYLTQSAFWLQQIFVLHIEQRRKDHYQMFTHHIITCLLIAASYANDLTPVGNVILVLMDFVDILLPFAKLLKYLGHTTLCDLAFIVFLVGWIVTRHIFYPMVLRSIWVDASVIPSGCFVSATGEFEPHSENDGWQWVWTAVNPRSGKSCMDAGVRQAFFWLLVMLQVLLLVWLYMIVKVAMRVVRGGGADDVRSDDEDDGEADEEEDEEEEGPVRLQGDAKEMGEVLRNGNLAKEARS